MNVERYFPLDKFPAVRAPQRQALDFLQVNNSALMELPVGSGKTAVGYAFLKALEAQGKGPLFYLVPNKALALQVKNEFPEFAVAFGRNEFPCFYYEPEAQFMADEIPCSLLTTCAHRVDQTTGQTFGEGARRCPYLSEKYLAKQQKIVVCTVHFYLFTQLFSRDWEPPAGLVIDEVHQLANIFRSALSHELSSHYLQWIVGFMKTIDETMAQRIDEFQTLMVAIARRRPEEREILIEQDELGELLASLKRVKTTSSHEVQLVGKAKTYVAGLGLNAEDSIKLEVKLLKQVETLLRSLKRYVRSLEYSLEKSGQRPLNYLFATSRQVKERNGEEVRTWYSIVFKGYYVAPLIQWLLGKQTLAYSATIGNPEILIFETGIDLPFLKTPGTFATSNTKIFLPTDTPNLSHKVQQARSGSRELNKVLRQIVGSCQRFAEQNVRSLVVVSSNKQLEKFTLFSQEAGLQLITYGEKVRAKDAAAQFREGEGDTLAGTTANFGMGLDLPRQIAPVIFYLCPGYPNPQDPQTMFEEARFGGMKWKLWNWRMMIKSLQVRGRNIRSNEAKGVTFYISQQFRSFLGGSIPEWLWESYRHDLTFDQAVEETMVLLAVVG